MTENRFLALWFCFVFCPGILASSLVITTLDSNFPRDRKSSGHRGEGKAHGEGERVVF